jgi:aryl carrier-like protein
VVVVAPDAASFVSSQMLRVNDGGTAWPLPFTAWEDTMERRTHHSIHELLQQDRYTPEEVSELLGIGLDVIRHAAFAGTLPADIEGHDIISLQRDDVLAWLQTRDGSDWGQSTVTD